MDNQESEDLRDENEMSMSTNTPSTIEIEANDNPVRIGDDENEASQHDHEESSADMGPTDPGNQESQVLESNEEVAMLPQEDDGYEDEDDDIVSVPMSDSDNDQNSISGAMSDSYSEDDQHQRNDMVTPMSDDEDPGNESFPTPYGKRLSHNLNENGQEIEIEMQQDDNDDVPISHQDQEDDEDEDDIVEIENENPERIVHLPASKIRRIMRTDNQVKIIAKEAVTAVTIATELFISLLAQQSHKLAANNKKKTVQLNHLKTVLPSSPLFDFLEGTLPEYDI